ncbi:hypothetical protein GCM10010363_29550 [Streptomyces omiyaensis]|nr:hypothetical protein GCM10010363_29550 [Streptomyces omiyaensis]
MDVAGVGRLRPPGGLVLPPELPGSGDPAAALRDPDLAVRHDAAEVVLAQFAGAPLAGDAPVQHPAGRVVAEAHEGGEVGLAGGTVVRCGHAAAPRTASAGAAGNGGAVKARAEAGAVTSASEPRA